VPPDRFKNQMTANNYIRRPPTAEEVSRFTGMHPPYHPNYLSVAGAHLVGAGLVLVLLFWIGAAFLDSVKEKWILKWYYYGSFALCGVFFLITFLRSVREERKVQALKAMAPALRVVEEMLVAAGEAVLIDDSANGQGGYCYRLDENRMVVLRGVEEDDLANGTLLVPNSNFKITRDADSKTIIRIEYSGDVLEPVAMLNEELNTRKFADGDIVECDWEKLKKGRVKI
jgi:hypothetical protein